MTPRRHAGLALALLSCASLLGGCASNPDDVSYADPEDPFEEVNRVVNGFNSLLDKSLLEPTAVAYTKITPEPVQDCLRNMNSNLREPVRVVGHAIAGDGMDALVSGWRFLANTFVGGFGCWQAADKGLGVKKRPTDIGLGLRARLKPQQSIYLVMPLFGPTTLIDGTGTALGAYVDPVDFNTNYNFYYTKDNVSRSIIYGARAIEIRAGLLDVTDLIDAAALDPYLFVRDAYLERRAALADDIREAGR